MKENISDRDNKISQIIAAAQARFGLYGIEKTSMREIASDLKLSKASLYYYFPDKESLYKAVVEKEQDEFISRIMELSEKTDDPAILLLEYSDKRLSYFRTLLNLSKLRLETFSDMKPVFRETIRAFKEKEKDIVIHIFEKGIKKGIFAIEDTDSTASLFLDLLKGLRVSVVNAKHTLFIEHDEYNSLKKKTLAFTELFIKGISIR
jgi:AcrR family transcriptional regulator